MNDMEAILRRVQAATDMLGEQITAGIRAREALAWEAGRLACTRGASDTDNPHL